MTRIEVPNPAIRSSAARRLMRRLALLILLVLVGLGLWTWLTLSWAYSDGERAGVLQKFSRKGWVCKTYEGEIAFYYGGGQYLAPGASPQMWEFSVRDKTVAAQLNKAVGHRVQLHYTEHRGIPTSCFAETRYFVDRVTDEEVGNQSSPAPNPSAPPASLPDVRPGATINPPPLPPKP
ncbi:MAG: hypothetical protein ACLQO1_16290 [Steroidobacteraceae bacterium]